MDREMDPFARLASWYEQQCDGEWEHHSGVSIESLDNPGWKLEVDLKPAPADQEARTIAVDGSPPTTENGYRNGPSWMVCEVRDGKFMGAGDPSRLVELVSRFLAYEDGRALGSR
jgi:Immunity protein 53